MSLTFTTDDGEVAYVPRGLVVAGWAGRDEASLCHHVEELAALGVPRPGSMPVFYRLATSLLTQAPRIAVLGPHSSGEAEPVIVMREDGPWLGLGSDHTDREAETVGIALSKQLCGKPLARGLWRLDEALLARWDALRLTAHATIDGARVPYQDATLAALRPPADLLARWARDGNPGGPLPPGWVMFGGTVPALRGIRPADRFEMALHDPATGRRLGHAYDVEALPVVA